MRRVLFLFSILIAGLAPFASAQEHGQVGVYANYLRLSQTRSNCGGLGGRLSVNTGRYLQLEGEMSYDFEQAFTEGFTDNSTIPPTVTFQRSNLRVLHGLFDPKL